MTEQAFPRPARFPWLLPLGIFAVVLGALIALVLFARQAGESDAPPQPPEFVAPQLKAYTAFDVEANAAGKLKVSSGGAQDASSFDLDLPAGTRVWLMEEVEASAIQPPLKVNVIGIPNEVRNYTLRMMVLAAPEGPVTFETPFIPLFDGYFGHEASRDQRERLVLSVLLESFDGRNGVTATANGPGTLYIDAEAPVRLVRQGSPAEIQAGDRLAVHDAADGSPDLARGVLVLVGGAK